MGQALGYAAGVGNASLKLSYFEFHRERHTKRKSRAEAFDSPPLHPVARRGLMLQPPASVRRLKILFLTNWYPTTAASPPGRYGSGNRPKAAQLHDDVALLHVCRTRS